jgi:hypothetical protein
VCALRLDGEAALDGLFGLKVFDFDFGFDFFLGAHGFCFVLGLGSRLQKFSVRETELQPDHPALGILNGLQILDFDFSFRIGLGAFFFNAHGFFRFGLG